MLSGEVALRNNHYYDYDYYSSSNSSNVSNKGSCA